MFNDELLNEAGVREILKVKKSHFHLLRESGRFPVPPIKLGRCVRWRKSDVLQWLDEGCAAV